MKEKSSKPAFSIKRLWSIVRSWHISIPALLSVPLAFIISCLAVIISAGPQETLRTD
jgi:hypothetical protein